MEFGIALLIFVGLPFCAFACIFYLVMYVGGEVSKTEKAKKYKEEGKAIIERIEGIIQNGNGKFDELNNSEDKEALLKHYRNAHNEYRLACGRVKERDVMHPITREYIKLECRGDKHYFVNRYPEKYRDILEIMLREDYPDPNRDAFDEDIRKKQEILTQKQEILAHYEDYDMTSPEIEFAVSDYVEKYKKKVLFHEERKKLESADHSRDGAFRFVEYSIRTDGYERYKDAIMHYLKKSLEKEKSPEN